MPTLCLSKNAINEAIMAFEVSWSLKSGFAIYNKKYARPVVPDPVNTNSGVTIGIGYDCGQYSSLMKDNFYKTWIYIVIVTILLAFCIVQFSCTTVKKGYKVVGENEPRTKQDSSNFYSRAAKLIKPLPPQITPGKTIRVPYQVDKLIKDTALIKKYIDSLNKVHYQSDSINKDECLRMVNESFNKGYDTAVYELSKQVQTITLPTFKPYKKLLPAECGSTACPA